MTRKIIHIDLDAFFCAVEELREPRLIGKPFAVGGRPDERGVVSSCSYPARRHGVHSAMPMAIALRTCPNLLVVSPHFEEYSRYSEQMAERLYDLTPLVEQVSIDEAFLDVSDIQEPIVKTANQLQQRINLELKLPCSLGVASNKLVAKIANDYGKSIKKSEKPPNHITIVDPGHEAEFLEPLKVDRLWGVGPKTAERLNNIGIWTIGDLANYPEKELVRLYGKTGYDLASHAKGIDESPVVTFREMKSISQETTFSQDLRDYDELVRVLKKQSERVGKRLREQSLAGATVKIKLRWPDFSTITRQVTLSSATNESQEIFAAALSLFRKEWTSGKAIRLIGVGVTGLDTPSRQLKLWDTSESTGFEKKRHLQTALDHLRDRYGQSVIKRLSDLDEDEP